MLSGSSKSKLAARVYNNSSFELGDIIPQTNHEQRNMYKWYWYHLYIFLEYQFRTGTLYLYGVVTETSHGSNYEPWLDLLSWFSNSAGFNWLNYSLVAMCNQSFSLKDWWSRVAHCKVARNAPPYSGWGRFRACLLLCRLLLLLY